MTPRRQPQHEMPWWAPFALVGMGLFLAACCVICWVWNCWRDLRGKE